ncbi:MAG: hypothetical protein AAGL10_06580 [Pseudomonadota bacterium]
MMIKLPFLGAAAVSALGAPLAAQDVAPAQEVGLAGEKAAPSSPFAEATPIDEEKLAKIAGREDINQFTNADQNNSVNGNDVGDNSVTGTINVSDQAFSNSNGFVILNANTGNNVAINASIQVNVALPSASVPGQ